VVNLKTENWHVLVPWLAFTIYDLEEGYLDQCQFKVTRLCIIFICCMVFRYDGK